MEGSTFNRVPCSQSDRFGRSALPQKPSSAGDSVRSLVAMGTWPLVISKTPLFQFLNHWRLEPAWHLQHYSVTLWLRKVTEAFHFFTQPGLNSHAVNSKQNVHAYTAHDLGDVTVPPQHSLSPPAYNDSEPRWHRAPGSVHLWIRSWPVSQKHLLSLH